MRKPFDIEKAKAGAKIITREGRHARILAYDLKNEDYKLVVVIQAQPEESYSEEVYSFTEEGKFYVNGEQSDKDLFIEDEPTYRPYANAEEMDAAIKEHGAFVKNLDDRRLTILNYADKHITIGGGQLTQYATLLEYYKWLDGTPCGVKEGGADE